MNTIYIVDDESIVLDGLVNLVEWSKINVKVLGTASSGNAGVNEILYLKPDVVITDIRMPGKDGLKLIEEVQQVLPQTAFIVISGYDEFSYAQKAMHYGVVEYLLKPVDEEKVLEVVEKALYERKSLSREIMYPNNLNNVRKIELFRKMLNPCGWKDDECQTACIAVCSLPEYAGNLPEIAAEIERMHLEEYGIYYSRNYMEFILLFTREQEDITWVLTQIGGIFEKNFHISAFWGICRCQAAGFSFRRAYLYSRQTSLTAAFYCVPWLDFTQVTQEYKEDPFHKAELFREFCKEEDGQKIYAGFDGAYRKAVEKRVEPRVLKREMTALLQFLVASFIEKYNTSMIQGKCMQDSINAIEGAENYRQLTVIMKEVLKNIEECCFERSQNYKAKMIDKIKQYVDDNMNQPIDIGMIAEHVNLSQNYVGSYFKNYEGILLSDYILKMKMEKAMVLLKNSTMKINHIAMEVGFNDPKYFCRVFKKYTGKTASGFRKK